MASYEKSKASGKWSVRFRIVEDGTEKNKRLSGFSKKSEAEKAYREYLAEDARKNRVAKSNEEILFSDVYRDCYKNAKKNLKLSSLYDMESIADLYVLPQFGDRKICEIKAIEVLNWQNGIDKSSSYIKKIRWVMSSVFRFADDFYDIPSPMKKVTSPKDADEVEEMEIWSEEEFQKFIAVVDDPMYRTLFYYLYLSGCRIGEAIALHRSDINKDKNTVSITKSISKKGKTVQYETTPKNKPSIRVISMPSEVIEMMLDISKDTGSKYVFHGKKLDAAMSPKSVRNKMVKYCELSEVKFIRIHDLRHSHASLLLSHNVSIVAVSKRLGHKTVTQTLNRYAHLLPRDEGMVTEVVGKVQIHRTQ